MRPTDEQLRELLALEARCDLDPLESTHITSAGYTHLANLTECINDPADKPHYRGRCIAMTYIPWSDLLAAARNNLRAIVEELLERRAEYRKQALSVQPGINLRTGERTK